jgi:hypothetical protein
MNILKKLRLIVVPFTRCFMVLFLASAGPLRAGDQEYSAVMAWGTLEMFERGSSGKLMNRSFNPEKNAWSAWDVLSAESITSSPSALLTDGGTRLAIFFRGTDGKLYHIFRDKETPWSRVIGLGSQEMLTTPTAVIVAEVLTVFARNTDGTLMKIYYEKEKGSWTVDQRGLNRPIMPFGDEHHLTAAALAAASETFFTCQAIVKVDVQILHGAKAKCVASGCYTVHHSPASSVNPIFTVTCQCATLLSSMCPRISLTSNQRMLRIFWPLD